MGYLLALIRAILIVVSMSIFMITYSISLLFSKHTNKRAFRLRKNWVRLGNRILGVKIEHEGQMTDTPGLYISNHRSFSDPIIISKFVNAFVIAKAEVDNIPILKYGFKLTGVIYVKRDSLTSRAKTREAYQKTVEEGYNVLVYPEGTTSSEVTTLPFKKGTFKTAADKGFPVVPIALSYKSPKDLWSEGGIVKQYFRQFSKWRTHVKVWIGEPILSDDGTYLVTETKRQIDEKLLAMNQEWQQSK